MSWWWEQRAAQERAAKERSGNVVPAAGPVGWGYICGTDIARNPTGCVAFGNHIENQTTGSVWHTLQDCNSQCLVSSPTPTPPPVAPAPPVGLVGTPVYGNLMGTPPATVYGNLMGTPPPTVYGNLV